MGPAACIAPPSTRGGSQKARAMPGVTTPSALGCKKGRPQKDALQRQNGAARAHRPHTPPLRPAKASRSGNCVRRKCGYAAACSLLPQAAQPSAAARGGTLYIRDHDVWQPAMRSPAVPAGLGYRRRCAAPRTSPQKGRAKEGAHAEACVPAGCRPLAAARGARQIAPAPHPTP